MKYEKRERTEKRVKRKKIKKAQGLHSKCFVTQHLYENNNGTMFPQKNHMPEIKNNQVSYKRTQRKRKVKK